MGLPVYFIKKEVFYDLPDVIFRAGIEITEEKPSGIEFEQNPPDVCYYCLNNTQQIVIGIIARYNVVNEVYFVFATIILPECKIVIPAEVKKILNEIKFMLESLEKVG